MLLAIIALVGLVSGWFMGASAAAWGALSVPMLVLGGVEPAAAISSSLAASVLLSLFGGLNHWRYQRPRVVFFVPLVVGGVGGALLGSFLSPALPASALRFLIGVMAVFIGLVTLSRKNGSGLNGPPDQKVPKWRQGRTILLSIGIVAGTAAGAFGAGWGTIGVALLLWTGIPPHIAVGASLLARSAVAVTAAGSYTVQMGAVPADIFFPLLLAGGVGVLFGVRTSNGFSVNGMQRFLGGVITGVGILTVVKILW